MGKAKDVPEAPEWLAQRPPLADVIARRALVALPSRRRHVVRIGRPERCDARTWRCGFHISGIGMRRPFYAFGVDSFQALILALDVIPSRLESAGAFSWLDQEAGEHGFPRHVPTAWGVAFSRRIERLLDREVLQYSKKLAGKAGRRKKRPDR